MLLALDINSKITGYAFGGPSDGKPRVAFWQMSGGEDLPRACGSLYASIIDLSKVLHPRFVVIEAPLQMGKRSAHTALVLMALYGAACAAGKNAGARVKPVAVGTWRKHFVGHGRPEDPKGATIRRCQLLGYSVQSDDEADAAGIWNYGMSLFYPKWAPKGTPLFRELAGVSHA